MTSHNVEMNNTVRNGVCLDVIVNGLVVNQTLFVQTVTCMEFLEHDKLVPPNDIVQPIITYTECSISAIALLISIIISRKLGLTNSIPGNNLENLCVVLGLSNVLFMIGIGLTITKHCVIFWEFFYTIFGWFLLNLCQYSLCTCVIH